MGKVTATQRLIVEDFPDQKEWIPKMFSVINDYFQKVQTAINGGIEFSSNITGMETTFDFIYASHDSSLPLKIKWGLSSRPKAVQVVAGYIGGYSGNLWNSIDLTTTGTTTNVGVIGVTSVITSVGSTANLSVGRKISGTNIPANSFVLSFTSNTITICNNAGTPVACTGVGAGVTLTLSPATSVWDTTTSAVLISNKLLIPAIINVAWSLNQSNEIEISDFSVVIGSVAKVTTPMAGQRVSFTVRITP